MTSMIAGAAPTQDEQNRQRSIPLVGDAATIVSGSDKYPATVIAVSRTGHKITVQEDTATRIDSNGMSEVQEYTYERNPNGRIVEKYRTRDGRYPGLHIGSRRKWHDFSF